MDGPAFPTDRAFPPSAAGATGAASGDGIRLFGADGFSFWDLVDIVNPLQHIPVVSALYRKISGDTLDALPRIAGGVLFGGMTGAVSAVVNLVVNEATGKDIGGNVLALAERGLGLVDGDAPDAPPTDAPETLLAEAPAFSAGWRTAAAMPYCDAECLDAKRSFFVDAVALAAMAAPPPERALSGDSTAAAARYAEVHADAAEARSVAGQRLDMRS